MGGFSSSHRSILIINLNYNITKMETYKVIIIAIIIVIIVIVEIYNRYKPNIEIRYEVGKYNVILWYYKHKEGEIYRTYIKLFKI